MAAVSVKRSIVYSFYLPFTLGSRGYFFLIDTDGPRPSRVNEVRCSLSNREPYQTVSTVYFILGILRTDLWSQGIFPFVRVIMFFPLLLPCICKLNADEKYLKSSWRCYEAGII